MSRYILHQAMPVSPIVSSLEESKYSNKFKFLTLWHCVYNLKNLNAKASKFAEILGLSHSFVRNRFYYRRYRQFVWCLEYKGYLFFIKINDFDTIIECIDPSTECVKSFIDYISIKVRVNKLRNSSTE